MKAFDKVPHQRLLNKLNMYNIDKPYTEWIKAFLLGRKQRVIVNVEKSDWKDVTIGIPQGSVLSPLLFVIYINDLPSVPSKGAEVSQEKDLGLIIDENLSFEQHIAEKIKKANSIMGVIRRTMEHLDCYNFKLLFTTLVRPHLEYANSVWSPHLVKFIDAVENVHRRATKQIPGLGYEDRLKKTEIAHISLQKNEG